MAGPNLEVLTYIDDVEEYGKTTEIKVYNPDDELPYSKAEEPENTKGIILVSGGPA